MKRSILLVICDFLILSALSFSTGIGREGSFRSGNFFYPYPGLSAPSQYEALNTDLYPSTTQLEIKKSDRNFTIEKIENYLKTKKLEKLAAINRQLDENNIELKKDIQKKVGEINQLVDLSNDLKKTANDLKTQLAKRVADINKMKQHQSQLLNEKTKLQVTLTGKNKEINKLENLKNNLNKEKTGLKENLNKKGLEIAQLEKLKTDLKKKTNQLQGRLQTRDLRIARINESKVKLQKKYVEIQNKANLNAREMAKLSERIKNLHSEKENLKKNLNNKQGEIQKLSKLKQSLEKDTQEMQLSLKDKELKIDGLRKNTKILVNGYLNLKKIIRDKDTNISNLKSTYMDIKDNYNELKKDLDTKKTEIDDLKKKLIVGPFVWEKYTDASRELYVLIREREPFLDDFFKKTLFLPEIKLGTTNYLVAEFDSIGLGWSEISEGHIKTLVYRMVQVVQNDQKYGVDLILPILSLKKDPRICLFELPGKLSGKALIPIGIEKLIKRGLENVYVFNKKGNSHQVSCTFYEKERQYLKVSSMLPDKPYAKTKYIQPQKGDFIFTKEGGFIGIMVTDNRAFIFPENIDKAQCYQIPVTKKDPKSHFYTGFVKKVLEIKQIKRKLSRK